jgi:hypothetical protein
LGFDIFLDHKLKPWVLEVNHSPSFTCDSDLDTRIKHGVILDAMNLLNLSPVADRKKFEPAGQQNPKVPAEAMDPVKEKKSKEEERDAYIEALTAYEDKHLVRTPLINFLKHVNMGLIMVSVFSGFFLSKRVATSGFFLRAMPRIWRPTSDSWKRLPRFLLVCLHSTLCYRFGSLFET